MKIENHPESVFLLNCGSIMKIERYEADDCGRSFVGRVIKVRCDCCSYCMTRYWRKEGGHYGGMERNPNYPQHIKREIVP